MKHDEFIGQVQDRGDLDSRGGAEQATRTVLETLGERLGGGEPSDLASQLPPEIGIHLRRVEEAQQQGAERFDPPGFITRVTQKAQTSIDEQTAAHWIHAVLSVTRDAVTPGEWDDVVRQVPDGYFDAFGV